MLNTLNTKYLKTLNTKYQCSECGKQFRVQYWSNGTSRFLDRPCNCVAPSRPIPGEPTYSEWEKNGFKPNDEKEKAV